jgi:hypothetical protein
VIGIEGSRSEFRSDEEEDAGWARLRITANIPADQADDRFDVPFLEGKLAALRSGFRKEIARGTRRPNRAETIRTSEEKSPQV